jgi:ribosomal-protein-alanine N-acetyltransferase
MTTETARLSLRPPRLADVPSLFEFLGDGKAMRHTHVDVSMRACRRRVAVHEWRRRHDGFAPWTVVARAGGRVIGWGGLYIDPFEPGWGVELGYFFHASAWGQGYASELVAACLHVADQTLHLPGVSAFAHPANAGSQRVLKKAGARARWLGPDLTCASRYQPVRMTWASPAASFRSVLLIRIESAAFACRASMQITGSPRARSSPCSQTESDPVSRPTRATPDALSAMDEAIASGVEGSWRSASTLPASSTTQIEVASSDTSNPT